MWGQANPPPSPPPADLESWKTSVWRRTPVISGAYRAGDIRHAVADVSLATEVLGWRAAVPFRQGVFDLVAWAKGEQAQGPSG